MSHRYVSGVKIEPSTSAHLIYHLIYRYQGRCLQRNLWYRPPASMTSHLASVTFKMANKVFIEETDKNFDFIKTRFKYFFGIKCPVV